MWTTKADRELARLNAELRIISDRQDVILRLLEGIERGVRQIARHYSVGDSNSPFPGPLPEADDEGISTKK